MNKLNIVKISIVIILINGSFLVAYLGNSSSNIDELSVQSSDIISEDADEFIEGSMDNLILNDEQYLSLEKESVDDYWTELGPGSVVPSGRSMFSIVHNSQNRKTILFGGLDAGSYPAGVAETYVYDSNTNFWTKMNPTTSPSKRHRHSMVYDYNSDNVILFGGYDYSQLLSDTWVYDLVTNTWTNMNPTGSPGTRQFHSMALASNSSQVILFSGYTMGGLTGTTWAYNLTSNTWTNKNPVMKPTARYNHAMVYATNSNKVFLFGGDGSWGGNTPLNDTWVYDLITNNWTEMNPGTAPMARYSHSMAYDENSDNVILFGGYNGTSYFNDTWSYDFTTNNWTKMNPATNPSSRQYHSMVYDSSFDIVFLFGGENGGYLDDTWFYDLKTDSWIPIDPANPKARFGHSTIYNDNSDKVILFGGNDGTSCDDTWVYDLTTNSWTKMHPITKPSSRQYHSMVYAANFDKVILFGGYNGSHLNDTWVYDLKTNTWTKMNPVNKPSARFRHSMVYNVNSDELILFGGDNGTYLDDTWIYDLTTNTWIQKSPLIHPNARNLYSMVYASSFDKTILFGGYDGTPILDNWLYPGNTYHQTGTFVSRLTCFKDIFSITGEFTWDPSTQPAGTQIKFQVGLSNTTEDKDFHYTNYYTSDFTFSGLALYLKYRVIFESDANHFLSPNLKRVIIYYSFEPIPETSPTETEPTTPGETTAATDTIPTSLETTTPPGTETTTSGTTTTTEAETGTFPGVFVVLLVLSTLVVFTRKRKSI